MQKANESEIETDLFSLSLHVQETGMKILGLQ